MTCRRLLTLWPPGLSYSTVVSTSMGATSSSVSSLSAPSQFMANFIRDHTRTIDPTKLASGFVSGEDLVAATAAILPQPSEGVGVVVEKPKEAQVFSASDTTPTSTDTTPTVPAVAPH